MVDSHSEERRNERFLSDSYKLCSKRNKQWARGFAKDITLLENKKYNILIHPSEEDHEDELQYKNKFVQIHIMNN